MTSVPDPKVWTAVEIHGEVLYSCKLCKNPARKSFNCPDHEKTKKHHDAVNEANQRAASSSSRTLVIQDAARALLVSGSSRPCQPLYPSGHKYHREPNFPESEPAFFEETPSPATGMQWHLLAASDDTTAEVSQESQLKAQLFDIGLSVLNSDSDADEGDWDVLGNRAEPEEQGFSSEGSTGPGDAQPRKRARGGNNDPVEARRWYPWPDRISCTLDILTHLPRSVFSRKQLDLFLWLLQVNQVDDVPSTKASQAIHASIQNLCGIQTLQYDGRLGHRYHVNSLGQILAQEMCNPKVRPNLYFYPEDTGEHLEEARQASRWLHELPMDEATPMIRL